MLLYQNLTCEHHGLSLLRLLAYLELVKGIVLEFGYLLLGLNLG